MASAQHLKRVYYSALIAGLSGKFTISDQILSLIRMALKHSWGDVFNIEKDEATQAGGDVVTVG